MEAGAIRVPRRRSAGRLATATDEQLAARVRAGDDEAFAALYDRHAGSLLAFCRQLLGSREEAEDALQHVFVAAYREVRGAQPPARLKPWLYAVARNRCISLLRGRRDALSLDAEQAEPVARDGDVARAVQQRQELREILDDLAGLPEDQRTALVLAEVGAMSHDEIALALDVRKDKVKALVFRARQSLMGAREARETSCREIQEQLSVLRGGALRRNPIRRHVAACAACAAFKEEVQRQRSALAAAIPVLPAVALKDSVLAAAFSGGAGAAGAGLAGGGGAAGVAAASAASAATAPSASTAAGLLGAGSSSLLTKTLATLAIAGTAGGAGAVTLHETHRAPAPPAVRSSAATPAPPARAAAPAAALSAGARPAASAAAPAAASGLRRGAGKGRAARAHAAGSKAPHRPPGQAMSPGRSAQAHARAVVRSAGTAASRPGSARVHPAKPIRPVTPVKPVKPVKPAHPTPAHGQAAPHAAQPPAHGQAAPPTAQAPAHGAGAHAGKAVGHGPKG